MSFFSDLTPDAASRVLAVIAVGALTTAGAGVGTAAVLTGSTNPEAWTAAYQLARECQQPGAAGDPNCSPAAARAIAEQDLAARLEREAQQLGIRRPTASHRPRLRRARPPRRRQLQGPTMPMRAEMIEPARAAVLSPARRKQ